MRRGRRPLLAILGILGILGLAAACASQPTPRAAPRNTRPEVPPPVSESRDGNGDARLEREEWFLRRRVGADGKVPVDAFDRAARRWAAWSVEHTARGQREKGALLPFAGKSWQERGPGNIAGRVISVAVDPHDPATLWAGSAGGGLWKSSDFGQTWRQMGGDHLPSLWIGAIAVDPADSDVVIMGTGEANGNYGGYGGFGGMLKTTDGGRSFRQIPLPEYQFYQTVISRTDSRLVLTATNGGVYRSADGGLHFTRVFLEDATDLAQDPKNPARFILVHANAFGDPDSGLRESLDAGLTWHPLGSGLPDPLQWGRTAIAFSPAPSAVLYLAIGMRISGSFAPGLYRSTDGGRTWIAWASQGEKGYSGVSWYGAHLAVSPTDPDLLLQANGGSVLLSRNGGRDWQVPGGDWHVDTHGIAFHPLAPQRVVLATDGGVAVSRDGGGTFERVDRGFPTVQLYSCALGLADPSTLFGGTQDNWMSIYRGAPGGAWEYSYPPGLGDVGAISVDPGAPQRMIAVTALAADVGYSLDEGRSWEGTRQNGMAADESAPWAPRLARSPLHPRQVYLGGRYLEASADGGRSWRPILIRPPELGQVVEDVAISPADDLEIWTLWSDGRVFLTQDGGATWLERSPSAELLRQGNRISAGPVRGSAFIALAGTSGPRVFHTNDGGRDWTDIGADLPDLAINTVLADPRQAGLLYVATDAGVALSTDNGKSWQDVSGALPRAVVLDLCLDPLSGRLAAATYGRGLWELAPVAPCAPGATTLCLEDARFAVEVTWRTAEGRSGAGQAVALTRDTGYFWFFDPGNVEMVLKVLDACDGFDRFWVFAGGLTDVQVDIKVTDIRTGVVKTYRNPQGKAFQPIQDAAAFATCP